MHIKVSLSQSTLSNTCQLILGEFHNMAPIKTVPAISLSLVASLAGLMAGCAAPGPSVMVVATETEVTDRFSSSGLTTTDIIADEQYTTAVPRAYIEQGELAADAPDTYTVVKGDTLWDISDRFLRKPWMWTEIWGYNPQIYNPHLIYPGDVLALEYVGGRPTLLLTRKGVPVPINQPKSDAAEPVILDADGNPLGSNRRVRLSPRIRSESLDDAIPTISGESIQQFLIHPQVVDASVINSAPYVVGNFDSRLISALGHQVYVRGKLSREQTSYGIFRRSKELRDPVNNALLGYEVKHVADAKLLNIDDPSTLTIVSNKMETIAGDILLPSSEGTAAHQYVPRLPDLKGEGRIVSLVNAISQTGRDQVVVLNIGRQSQIKEGDVLAIETRGKSIVDRKGSRGYERLNLPNQRTGVVMVFKAFDKVSYALVMESTRPVMINDIITGI